MRIKDYTNGELEEELERRRVTERLRAVVPKRLDEIDWQPVLTCAESGFARMLAEHYEDDEFKHYIYEAVMTAVYGPGYWPWRGAQTW